MCLTPESLIPWGSALEQEVYLSYIKRMIKKIHFIFKFRLVKLYLKSQKSHAKTLDATIDENQLAAITERTILHTLSMIVILLIFQT